MRNYKMMLCLLLAVLFVFILVGCNNDTIEPQSTTEQPTSLESITNSITGTENGTTGSTELFYTEADDLEIMTAPAANSDSQNTTEQNANTSAPTKMEETESATEYTPDTEPTRIELPFVPAN